MGRYSEDQALVSTELCILEMIKSGTTSFVETLLLSRYGLDGITQAVIDSGMRGVLAKSVMDISTYASKESIMYEGMVEDGEECLKQAIEWKEKSENVGNGRVNIWLGPRPVGSTSDTMLKKVAATAEQYDMGIAIHFCEVTQDVKHMKQKYNMTPGEFGESTGIFTDRTLLAHGIWLEESDMEAIRRNGTTVVHCPASNANLASGFCKVPELLEAGVNVALATDGATCDNSTDMFDAMRLAAIIHKNRTLDPLVVPAETAIELATINGAKAIKKDHLIGSLEVGKKADIITIDCKNPRLVPNTNPVSTVVYSARGDDVDNVIIDGEFVVKNREILTMDEQNILDKANKTIVKVLEQAGKENKSKWKTL
jgi:cytosine/adenosine deaminase-related metal-dependent hydrolase